jgi:crossover junction endodeoxyribonuclease RuvC
MRVLGIDPGLATTGIAVVERDRGVLRPVVVGVIRTSGDADLATRLMELGDQVRALIEEHRPDAVAAERLFFNSNVATAIRVAQASGAALAAAARGGLEVHEYTPTAVKQSVVGVGNATKQQVQAMVTALLSLRTAPRPADAADACALAICHINRSGLATALAKQMAT